ncbi:MAG: DUF2125 domain-containing protein [Bdellovibrionales bacterium]
MMLSAYKDRLRARLSAHAQHTWVRRAFHLVYAVFFVAALYLMLYLAGTVFLWAVFTRQQAGDQPVMLTWFKDQHALGLSAPHAWVMLNDVPVTLHDLRLTWPLFRPAHLDMSAARAETTVSGTQITASNINMKSHIALPWTRIIDVEAQDVKVGDAGVVATRANTIIVRAPHAMLTRRYLLADDGKPAEAWRVETGVVIMPLGTGGALQIDEIVLGLSLNRAQPDWHNRSDVSDWQAGGGRLDVTDASLRMLDVALGMGGDVQLNSKLGLSGELKLQVSGIDRGYMRLGELGLISPEQYQALGNVLRLFPDAGARIYTLPVYLKDTSIYIGPAPIFKLPPVPWAEKK